MLALLTKRGGGKWALGGFGPLIEEIGIGAKRKIAQSASCWKLGSDPTSSDAWKAL